MQVTKKRKKLTKFYRTIHYKFQHFLVGEEISNKTFLTEDIERVGD